jgi:hypothetical protein
MILAEARAGALDDFPRIVFRRHPAPYRYRSTSAEFPQRNFLHRPPG